MRAFVAIDVTGQKLIDSIRQFQSKLDIDARAVKPENLHFTLQFLGHVSQDQLEDVAGVLSTMVFPAFDVRLNGVGAFPSTRSPRVVWIGTDASSSKAMTELGKKVQNTLKPLGFALDRPLKTHLTIFRVKKKIRDITEELRGVKTDFGVQAVTLIKLKQSHLTSSGSSYTDLLEVRAV